MTRDELAEEYRKVIGFCHKYGLKDYEDKLKDKLTDLLSPLKVMIVGEGKSGKSSLLNALVGADVAEVEDEPKTWCINLYTRTMEKPYAELVYPGKMRRVSPEEAHRISERISAAASMDDLEEEDRSLKEIRWHLELPWPEQDIFIVDTPGFNQYRKDTSVDEMSMNIGEGIRFVANDGFDKYYYKADLVLWCFCADSVNDKVVEEHLKSVASQGKRIYGIITKLDREETDKERERLFRTNEDRYRRYHLSACIRSMLPPVYDDDEPEEQQKKEQLRENTITGIREVIRYLLEDNGADSIKVENSENYLMTIRENITGVMTELLDFYCDNYDIHREVWEDFNTEGRPYGDKVKQEFRRAALEDTKLFSNQAFFSALWDQAGMDMERYARLISERISAGRIASEGKLIFRNFCDEIMGVIEHIYRRIRWKSVTVELYGGGDGRRAARLELEPLELDMPERAVDIVFNTEQMGLLYQLMQMFGRESFTGQLIQAFAGDIIRERAITSGQNAAVDSVNRYCEEYQAAAGQYMAEAQGLYRKAVDSCFVRLVGCSFENVPGKVIDLEQDMLKINALDRKELIYYPAVSYGNLTFFASAYSRRFKREPQKPSESLEDAFGGLMKHLFSTRILRMQDVMERAIAKYSGKEGVSEPETGFCFECLERDEELCDFLPELSKIEWYGEKNNIARRYDSERDAYRSSCRQKWNELSQQAKSRALRDKEEAMERDFKPDLTAFIKAWEQQVAVDAKWCIENQRLTALPSSMDYILYYYNIYIWQGRVSAVIQGIADFKQKTRLPKGWEEHYQVISPRGKPMTSAVQDMIKAFLDKKAKELERIREELGEKCWNPGIRGIKDYGCRICDGYLYQLDMFLENNLSETWKEYLKTSAEGKQRISNKLEYALKAGKLPPQFKNILVGMIPELTPYSGIICGDGRRLPEHWKDYIKTELEDYLKKWK